MTIDEAQVRDLIAKREAAEKAVDAMPDGPLKEKAFEVILQRLLDADTHPATKEAAPRAASGRRKQAQEGQAPSGKQLPAKRPRKAGPRAHLAELRADDFFHEAQTIPDMINELRNRGHIYKQTDLSPTLQRMTKAKLLRRKLIPRKDGKKGSVFGYTKFGT